ncbi:Glutamyl endopeptidase precursor [compost metagenome]
MADTLHNMVNGKGEVMAAAAANTAADSAQTEAFQGTGTLSNGEAAETDIEDKQLPSIESLLFVNNEEVCQSDDRLRVMETAKFPWSAVCRLIITLDDGRQGVGTGWLCGPATVITAGHCVFDSETRKWHKSIVVIPGKDDRLEPYDRFTVAPEHFWSVNGWVQDGNQEYDYGAIILNSTIGNNTGYLGFRYDPNDAINQKPILNTGYPSDKNGTQWYMKGIVNDVQERKVYYKLDTMGGNSGGPVCLGETNQAICIHAYGGCAANRSNSGTRINRDVYANVLKWKEAGASPQASAEVGRERVKV